MTRTRTALLLPVHDDLALDRAYPIDDLERLQKDVGGGYIEVVRLDAEQLDRAERLCGVKLGALGYVFLVVNEMGKLIEPPPPLNMVATLIFGAPHDVIVGSALIVEMPPSSDGGKGDASC